SKLPASFCATEPGAASCRQDRTGFPRHLAFPARICFAKSTRSCVPVPTAQERRPAIRLAACVLLYRFRLQPVTKLSVSQRLAWSSRCLYCPTGERGRLPIVPQLHGPYFSNRK